MCSGGDQSFWSWYLSFMQDKKNLWNLLICPGHLLLHRLWDEDVCFYSELVASSFSLEGTGSLDVSPLTLYLSLHHYSSTHLNSSPPPLRPLHLSSHYQCFTCSHLWLEDATCSAAFFDLIWLIVMACFSQRWDLSWLCQTGISFVQCVFFCVVLRQETGSVGRREEEYQRQDAWPLLAAYQWSMFALLIPRALTTVISQRPTRREHTSQRPHRFTSWPFLQREALRHQQNNCAGREL